jgi:hypothetical protein
MEMDAETAAVVVVKKDCLEKEAAEEAGEKLSGQQHHHHHHLGEGVISDAASTPVLPLAQVLSHFLSSRNIRRYSMSENTIHPNGLLGFLSLSRNSRWEMWKSACSSWKKEKKKKKLLLP